MNTGKAHGAALGDDEVAEVKKILGLRPGADASRSPTRCSRTPARSSTRGEHATAEWQKAFDAWAQANPERKALLDRASPRALPEGWADDAAQLGPGRRQGRRHPQGLR